MSNTLGLLEMLEVPFKEQLILIGIIIMKKKRLEALNYYMDILDVHVSDDDNYEMRQHIKSAGMKKPIKKALNKLASKLSES
jgi:hypothetical protein